MKCFTNLLSILGMLESNALQFSTAVLITLPGGYPHQSCWHKNTRLSHLLTILQSSYVVGFTSFSDSELLRDQWTYIHSLLGWANLDCSYISPKNHHNQLFEMLKLNETNMWSVSYPKNLQSVCVCVKASWYIDAEKLES